MQTENQYLIYELSNARRQISTLVLRLDDECQCIKALRKIESVKGSLNLVIEKIIHRQLNESVVHIEGSPSLSEYEDELNVLVELFRTLIARQINYQLTLNKVEHE